MKPGAFAAHNEWLREMMQRTEPVEDIDSDRPVWCSLCTVRPVDPDYAPFCGIQCSIEAENDE